MLRLFTLSLFLVVFAANAQVMEIESESCRVWVAVSNPKYANWKTKSGIRDILKSYGLKLQVVSSMYKKGDLVINSSENNCHYDTFLGLDHCHGSFSVSKVIGESGDYYVTKDSFGRDLYWQRYDFENVGEISGKKMGFKVDKLELLLETLKKNPLKCVANNTL